MFEVSVSTQNLWRQVVPSNPLRLKLMCNVTGNKTLTPTQPSHPLWAVTASTCKNWEVKLITGWGLDKKMENNADRWDQVACHGLDLLQFWNDNKKSLEIHRQPHLPSREPGQRYQPIHHHEDRWEHCHQGHQESFDRRGQTSPGDCWKVTRSSQGRTSCSVWSCAWCLVPLNIHRLPADNCQLTHHISNITSSIW